ncbi:hypothetical protein SRHO_G00225220 [Serrasalmus rhombeus]
MASVLQPHNPPEGLVSLFDLQVFDDPTRPCVKDSFLGGKWLICVVQQAYDSKLETWFTKLSWGVHSQQAFLLYCLALGPTDLSIHWHSNGRRLDTVNEYRHTFSHDAVLVSSWVREQPLSKDAHYQCVAVSKSGNDTSKIDLRLSSRDEANTFSEDLNQWREALADHERQLQNWKKAWESCDGQGVL